MGEVLRSLSPADPRDGAGRVAVAGGRGVADAVARARAAFPAWRDAGFAARAAVLNRFAVLVRDRGEELARLLAREVGKALWDARAEAGLLATKVDATLADGMRFAADFQARSRPRAPLHPRRLP